MIRVHLLPEMAAERPATPCAQIRLLRPYQHASVQSKFDVSVGRRLPRGSFDVVVTQRGGPVGTTMDDVVDLVREVRRRGAKLVYDLDDDLLAPHPVAEMEMGLRPHRSRVRFLLREADLVTVSTAVVRDHIAAIARRCVVVPNGLDERLIPPLQTERSGADVGYFGTATHMPDFMAIRGAIERSAARSGRAMRLELFGVSNDPRLRLLSGGHLWVKYMAEIDAYDDFHATLARDGCWKIGLAPLERSIFNDAKSDIKVLDYAACSIAVVAADSPVYADWDSAMIERAPHEDFDQAIGRLLEDDDHRVALVRNAHDHLLQTRTLTQMAPQIARAVEAILS
jgi:glycosyltransferase involved in cell wall biosynthesis